MRYRVLQEKVDTAAGPRWRNLIVVREIGGRLSIVGRTLGQAAAYDRLLRAYPLALDEIHRLPLPPDVASPGATMRWTRVRETDGLDLYRLLATEEPAGAGDIAQPAVEADRAADGVPSAPRPADRVKPLTGRRPERANGPRTGTGDQIPPPSAGRRTPPVPSPGVASSRSRPGPATAARRQVPAAARRRAAPPPSRRTG
ncbi:MAG: hypothetical protein JSV36_06300, partial [Anaerolineae bacterium]